MVPREAEFTKQNCFVFYRKPKESV